MIYNLGNDDSILNQYMSEIRHEEMQKDRMRFRRNLERVGEIFAYEISKKLLFTEKNVQTPLGVAKVPTCDEQIVLCSIMRAGLPMHQGFLNIFDRAENAFISAYRKYHKDGAFEIKFEYLSAPELFDKTLIIADPMLATGASMLLSYNALKEKGVPKHTHFVSLIASKEGIEQLKKNIPDKNFTLWVGAIDDELTVKAYIVPGLGDAGDLAYGDKE